MGRHAEVDMRIATRLAFVLVIPLAMAAQQAPDTAFDVSVKRPAFVREHPRLVLDEAHHNFHTADGRYQPFAALAKNDGYDVRRGTAAFTAASLAGARVLVIANALGSGVTVSDDSSGPAFTPDECAAVAAWVRGGGALLLISDHTPMGAAAESLASAFGVRMGRGYVFSVNDTYRKLNQPAQLVFSRANGLLGSHPILQGRDASEAIATVVSFTGQSLGVPAGATAILPLGPDTWEAPTRAALQQILAEAAGQADPARFTTTRAVRVAGRAQGLAMTFGRGRVVMLGEAAMMSAQVTGAAGGRQGRMGMNVPGSDDKQFALNVLHWLSGVI
jgi:hypothetical protein